MKEPGLYVAWIVLKVNTKLHADWCIANMIENKHLQN